MWLLPWVPPTPPSHLLVRVKLLAAQGIFFFQAGLNSHYKAGLINLCHSELCYGGGKENGLHVW